MIKSYLDIETADGTVHECVRVVAADKIRAAKIARLNGVPTDSAIELAEFIAFATATRTGIVEADNLEEFRAQVIDYGASDKEPESDPTRSAGEVLSVL